METQKLDKDEPSNITIEDGKIILQKIAKKKIDNFILDTYNETIYEVLLIYFLNKKNELYDLNKGLFIGGEVGTGKTIMLQIFKLFCQLIKANNFRIVSTREIISKYQKEGYAGIEQFSYNGRKNEFDVSVNKPIEICLDDIGNEIINVKHYGTEIDVIRELLEDRYDIMINYGKRLHITGNFTLQDISEKYGERLKSRFKEMFNYFELRGKDRRG
jgi:DNA replication protein DnaC